MKRLISWIRARRFWAKTAIFSASNSPLSSGAELFVFCRCVFLWMRILSRVVLLIFEPDALFQEARTSDVMATTTKDARAGANVSEEGGLICICLYCLPGLR